jgi:hypothetical protein
MMYHARIAEAKYFLMKADVIKAFDSVEWDFCSQFSKKSTLVNGFVFSDSHMGMSQFLCADKWSKI